MKVRDKEKTATYTSASYRLLTYKVKKIRKKDGVSYGWHIRVSLKTIVMLVDKYCQCIQISLNAFIYISF